MHVLRTLRVMVRRICVIWSHASRSSNDLRMAPDLRIIGQEVTNMKFLMTMIAALALTVGAWAECPGNPNGCPRGQGQGQGKGHGQGQGKCDPAECQNPDCPRAPGSGPGQQGSGNQKK